MAGQISDRLQDSSSSVICLTESFAKPVVALLIASITLAGCASIQPPANAPAPEISVESDAVSTPQPVGDAWDDEDEWQDMRTDAAPAARESAEPSGPQLLEELDLDPLFAQARQLVANETGIALDHITLDVVADIQIADEVARETERLVDRQFSSQSFANHFLGEVMENQSGTYAALFSHRTHQVLISRDLLTSYRVSLRRQKTPEQPAILALLIHELVHAADDERYAIHDNRTLSFRASFAQSAVFEGHAQWLTRKICQQHNCETGLQALDHFMFGSPKARNQLTQPVQAISRNVLEYSYVEGERFISMLAEQQGGDKLLQQLLQNPPADPVQILDPLSFPDTAREQRNKKLLDASRSVNHPWQQTPWAAIETSPLKGVNLRADPSRRKAAVDGFTRLMKAMVALQIYDQSNPDTTPVEITLLTAESADTARLFAETLHENTLDTEVFAQRWEIPLVSNGHAPARLFFSRNVSDASEFHTIVAVTADHVIQISAQNRDSALMADYALQTLEALDGQRLQSEDALQALAAL